MESMAVSFSLFTGLFIQCITMHTIICHEFSTALLPPRVLVSAQTADHTLVIGCEQWVHAWAGSGRLVGQSCHHDGVGQGAATGWTRLCVSHELDMPVLEE